MRQAVFLYILIISLSYVSFAQDFSNVSGAVKDQNGDFVVGAKVSLQKKTTVSDANGRFAFAGLATGKHKLNVVADGFETHSNSINISTIPESRSIEVVLKIDSTLFTVTAEVGQNVERRNTPQAVNVLTDSDIAQRTNQVLAQAGEEEAGLNVQRTSPTIGNIVVRGLTGKNVVVYVDGVRYSNSAQRGGLNTFLNLNEPSGLQNIEVLRGASSAQYGSDALGGTVNLVSKNNYVTSDDPEFRGEFSPVYNSSDRSFGGSTILSYGTNRANVLVNLAARRINTLRPAGGIDTHSALTRYLGLPSTILYDRLPDTEFTQYGGSIRLNYAPKDDQQLIFQYKRSQQDDGKRHDHLIGGNGDLIHNLSNLKLDFGYLRYVKENLGFFDSGSFTASFNSQREERQKQGGRGNPNSPIDNEYERTSITGFSFFLNRLLPKRNSFVFGGDFYHDKINSPAHLDDPVTGISIPSRPRVPDEGRFDSGGIFVQNAWDAIPNRLRLTGALRYSAMNYRVRQSDAPIVNGEPLWEDDSLRLGDFSGRIGGVVSVTNDLRVFANYSRGFRYPSMTDLGTLGLTGDGFEVNHIASGALGGTIGTTADENAVSTGLEVRQQDSEYTNNYDIGFRFQKNRFDTEFTFFLLDLVDTITKQSLILPQGAVGQFLGNEEIIDQLPNGVVFVEAASSPVLVRANFTAARVTGLEYSANYKISDEFTLKGNYTYIRAEEKDTGEQPTIEGGTPPPTGFLSFRYLPSGKLFWIEFYAKFAQKQDRLSTLDLSDRRTGATRNRRDIARFFQGGACARGLVTNPDGVCSSGDEGILIPTGETLAEVQNRLLGNANSAPLFTELPAYFLTNLRGGFTLGEKSKIFWSFENIFDQKYRHPSWGVDGAGRSIRVGYRYEF